VRECAVLPASRKIASERAHLLAHALTALVLARKGFRKPDHASESVLPLVLRRRLDLFSAAGFCVSPAVRLRRARPVHEGAGR
jgi:hypothetical protein